MTKMSFTFFSLFILTSFCQGQKKTELANDGFVNISYTVSKKEIKFYIKTNGGSPSIQVDVNKNGFIDDKIDRSYGIISGSGMKLCTQYLIDQRTSTGCGAAPSKANLSGKEFDYVFTIPRQEMTTPLKPDKVAVMISLFAVQSGISGFRYYPSSSKIFENVYEISIK